MIIRFNQVEEFIEELKKEYPNPKIPCYILRLTCSYQYQSNGVNPNALKPAPIKIGTVIATIKSASKEDIIRLERYCGEYWGADFKGDETTKANVETAFKSIEDACKELGIEVRAGIFEER